jgi:WD40 repeat protein
MRLIDALSGALLRTISRPPSTLLCVRADPLGLGVFWVVRARDDPAMGWDFPELRNEIQINLWDLEHLDRPVATLPWSRPIPMNRTRPGPLPRPGPGPLVALSPDARMVAVSTFQSTTIQLFSADDGKPLGAPVDTSVELSALALGPNALLAVAIGGTVRLWDLDTRTLLASLTPNSAFTRLMRFSPEGTLLAIAGPGPIELWDPVAQSLVDVLPMPDQAPAADLAFAVDGRSLAAVSQSGTTAVWTIIDASPRTQISGFDTRISSLAFSDDGTLAGGCFNGDIWTWRSGRCPGVGSPKSAQWTSETDTSAGPSGPEAASPASASLVRIAPLSSSAAAPALSANADASDQRRVEVARDRSRESDRPSRDGAMNPPRPTWVSFDAVGRLIAYDASGLRIWPVGSSSAQSPPSIQKAPPGAFASLFGRPPVLKSPDGQVLVLVRASSISLWRAADPDRLIPVLAPPRRRAEPALPPPKAGTRRGPLGGNTPRVLQIAPRADRIYVLEQNSLHVWALDGSPDGLRIQARELGTMPMGEGGIGNTALSPDGAILALGDRAESVTLVDTARLTVVGQIKPPPAETESFLGVMTFSPDGQELAVGSQQGTIFVWSARPAARPKLLFRLPGHRGLVSSLAYDTQGRRLASAASIGLDPVVEVWDLDLIERELNRLQLAD